MADFNLPVLTDSYTNVLAYLKNRDLDILMGLDPATTTPANVPNNAIRWNSANGYWEKLVSGTWGALISRYQIDVKSLMGYAPGNASGNIPLNNGTVNTNLNADMVDGHHAGTAASNVLLLDTGGKVPAGNLPTSGVTAGTYRSVTVDAYGRVTGGSNPTTLGGYGITDAASLAGNSGQDFSLKNGTFYAVLKSQYFTASESAGDMAAVRSGGTTGAIFLSADGTKYLYNDGSYYNLPVQDLKIKGNVAWHAGNFTPSNYLGVNAQAVDSAKLNGQAPSYYLAATAQAADSAKLGGQAPSVYATVAGLIGRNKLINGNFDVWQRGANFSGITQSGYVADRWFINVGNGATVTISRQSFALGQTTVPNNPSYYHSLAITTAGTGATTQEQRIEGVATLSGQQATLSFWAYANVAETITLKIIQNFGTGGTPSASVTTQIGTAALTTGWQKFTVTFTVPSVSGKTLGTGNNDYLSILFLLPVTVFTFNLAQVQMEAGATATQFEQRAIAHELVLCQRYYEMGDSYAEGGVYATGGWLGDVAGYNVWKRASPTISLSYQQGYGTASPTIVLGNCGQLALKCQITVASPAQVWWYVQWTANAEL